MKNYGPFYEKGKLGNTSSSPSSQAAEMYWLDRADHPEWNLDYGTGVSGGYLDTTPYPIQQTQDPMEFTPNGGTTSWKTSGRDAFPGKEVR